MVERSLDLECRYGSGDRMEAELSHTSTVSTAGEGKTRVWENDCVLDTWVVDKTGPEERTKMTEGKTNISTHLRWGLQPACTHQIQRNLQETRTKRIGKNNAKIEVDDKQIDNRVLVRLLREGRESVDTTFEGEERRQPRNKKSTRNKTEGAREDGDEQKSRGDKN